MALLLGGDLLLACLGGVMVALVVKKFDNIVKLYTQALANIFTAILCSLLFHEFFHLTGLFVVSLILVFTAIVMYELKHFNDIRNSCFSLSKTAVQHPFFVIATVVSIVFFGMTLIVFNRSSFGWLT